MMRKLGTICRSKQGGFTLVELMIVVAIIGILAAIAIPQFAAYRVRGFNSSALSDLRNIGTTQAAFYSDWQAYAISAQVAAASVDAAILAAAGGNGDGGLIVTSTPAASYPLLTGDDNGGNARATLVAMGNGVGAVVSTDTPATLTAFWAGISKHTQGDTYFAIDGDVSSIYQDNSAGNAAAGVGIALAAAPAGFPVTANINADDNLATTNGPSGQPWVVR